jgi:hypothetical protein
MYVYNAGLPNLYLAGNIWPVKIFEIKKCLLTLSLTTA